MCLYVYDGLLCEPTAMVFNQSGNGYLMTVWYLFECQIVNPK